MMNVTGNLYLNATNQKCSKLAQFMKTMQKLGGQSGLADLKTCSLD
jgi:hypothetical protein